MSNRYGGGAAMRNGNGYGNFGRAPPDGYDAYSDGRSSDRIDARYGTPPGSRGPPPPPAVRNMPSRARIQETSAERQITQVLEHIRSEWPSMCENDSIPVQLALQLLDSSSVGRAHEYRKFQETHSYLQDSLKNIVHEHHQGFNSSIGTFHKIQGSIQASQKRVRELKESLASSKASLCATDPELKKLSQTSSEYDELLQTLNELDDLRAVPDQLEARISEKRFLGAVEVLQNALRKLRRPELDGIGALSDLRMYLANQETALMDILVEELHEHLYLKSPYCQERWQNLAKSQGAYADGYVDANSIPPFHTVLSSIDLEKAATEDPMKNPEADTFNYIGLLVEALNRLGRLQNAVETLKQRLPVELFGVVNETINEVDQRHPSSLRGAAGKADGVLVYNNRETQMRADVIYDLLWTLYGKFEAIAEGQRAFHEFIKALIRREGAGNNSALLGSFKELWNLYQNEIRSLLHNYVTTDADVYQFDSPNPGANFAGKKETMREHLFKFSEADSKSVDMVTEYDALEGIIQATVPGLTSGSRKHGPDSKKNRVTVDGLSRRDGLGGGGSGSGGQGGLGLVGSGKQSIGSYKALVEPSVFNMSLLLPPTLTFLQRLKTIVPPGSDLATSTLTTFLDNFLVNVFQPQLDETLSKLSDTVFTEADSFLQDQTWKLVAARPVFKGTTRFFQIVTAFCKMLGTIPPDQALSSLIVTQMMRYYDRCFSWYRSLVTKTQEQSEDANNLRASARFSVSPGPLQEVMKEVWACKDAPSIELLSKEIQTLIEQTNGSPLEMNDIIQDRDTISALCLLYTSMQWLAEKISGLRHITSHETDSSRQALPRQATRRWTLTGEQGKAASDQGPVHLPLTQESVQTFDNIVSSYRELATTALLTLHAEVRTRIVHSLHNALSPSIAPYLLDQEVREPDPQILSLNLELVLFDETIVRYLRDKEVTFIRTGLGRLINNYLVGNAKLASPMNEKGCGRMQLNILVLQQNLKNVEEGVDLARAANYFALFDSGPDAIVEKAKEDKDKGKEGADAAQTFTYDELKALMELCFSEGMSNRERGIASAAKRKLDDKLLGLSEHMWQS
ncbi:exocyst complex component Sec8 [Pochonia chlamydosporia 170]|uniref:Exocyst complex component Sec8 n=1 Tax=Pochonia chlamydosporia 170 TaxID=1380566 RepID=A0A179FH18_METCM|nr:exocyst complex component Sec8 [Pochonia chlamydosporia 170]OAQ64812.1 exocyst complex component Sec8 [Pochonia chlamydosporia 170]